MMMMEGNVFCVAWNVYIKVLNCPGEFRLWRWKERVLELKFIMSILGMKICWVLKFMMGIKNNRDYRMGWGYKWDSMA